MTSALQRLGLLLLVTGLAACSASAPRQEPPYRQELIAPACASASTYVDTMRCDDDVRAGMQKEANQSLGSVENANTYKVHRNRIPRWEPPSPEEMRQKRRIDRVLELEQSRSSQDFTENCGSYRVDKGLLVCVPAPPN